MLITFIFIIEKLYENTVGIYMLCSGYAIRIKKLFRDKHSTLFNVNLHFFSFLFALGNPFIILITIYNSDSYFRKQITQVEEK